MEIQARCWNVCGLDPEGLGREALGATVRAWLGDCGGASVVSVGLVEVVELKPGTVVRESFSAPEESEVLQGRISAWRAALVDALATSHELLATEALVGLALFVFGATVGAYEIAPAALPTCRFRTGFGGLLGNKGAVAASLTATRGSDGARRSVCVVHAHFASDLNQVEARNAEYASIVSAADANAILSLSAALGDADYVDVLAHDLVVWQGDLNYRLASPPKAPPPPDSPPQSAVASFFQSLGPAARKQAKADEETCDADVRALVAAHRWLDLNDRDQLALAMANGDAFAGFSEAPRDFPPTYKLVRGTADYVANRRPAWCDRVLWKARNDADAAACDAYGSLADCTLSDHHPVHAALTFTF